MPGTNPPLDEYRPNPSHQRQGARRAGRLSHHKYRISMSSQCNPPPRRIFSNVTSTGGSGVLVVVLVGGGVIRLETQTRRVRVEPPDPGRARPPTPSAPPERPVSLAVGRATPRRPWQLREFLVLLERHSFFGCRPPRGFGAASFYPCRRCRGCVWGDRHVRSCANVTTPKQ